MGIFVTTMIKSRVYADFCRNFSDISVFPAL